jgi:hypothetical protein
MCNEISSRKMESITCGSSYLRSFADIAVREAFPSISPCRLSNFNVFLNLFIYISSSFSMLTATRECGNNTTEILIEGDFSLPNLMYWDEKDLAFFRKRGMWSDDTEQP